MLVNDIQLSEEVGMYLDRVRSAFPAIDQVWLTGPRVNEPGKRHSNWDLIMFADGKTLEALRRDPNWHRPDLNLLVVTDGEHFDSAWGEARTGSLEALGWRIEDAHTARYEPGRHGQTAPVADERRLKAIRVR
jgi:hypothetical protein